MLEIMTTKIVTAFQTSSVNCFLVISKPIAIRVWLFNASKSLYVSKMISDYVLSKSKSHKIKKPQHIAVVLKEKLHLYHDIHI